MIPIIFAINNTYVKQLATVIASILKNNNTKNSYEFNILSSDISSDNKFTLQKFVTKLSKSKSKINFVNMKEILKDVDLEKYMSRRDDYKYISIETYFRFFIPELFSNYKKVLYLDADILVFQDLSEFYNEDISDYYAGVIQDTVLEVFIEDKNIKTRTKPERDYKTYFTEKLHKTTNNYFNAGVLLLNLEKIREENAIESLWNFTIKESPLEFQDQDVLNSVWEKRVKYVDYKWNTLKDLNWFATQIKNKEKRKILLKTYEKPGIFHYVGSNKPWLIHDINYKYNFIKEWWNYYKLTPYFKRKELNILKHAMWMQKNWGFKCYITIRVLDFVFLDIYEDVGRLNFKILNFLKTYIRYKEPKSYTKIKSI